MIRISIQKKLALADGLQCLSIDTSLKKGTFTAIFGKSGVGKTSLLRMIAGLMQPETGTISSGDEVWLDSKDNIHVPVQKRNIGFVFQDLALFPNMTIRQNIQYALKERRSSNNISELLEMANLEELANRKPETLSGGQRQRVAICRALASKPGLLLLDEPFSSLDIALRQQLREYLFKLHKTFHLTTVLVSHDIGDIYHLADKVMVIDKGTIVKEGPPNEVFDTDSTDRKVKLQGEIINIRGNGIVYIAEILTGHTITRLLISEEEKENLRPGMKVMVQSGSFEPIITILD